MAGRGPTRSRIVLAALATALLATLPAAPARAAQRDLLGVVLLDQQLDATDLQALEAGRVANVRLTIFRQLVEPNEGDYHWQNVDTLIGDLASRGIVSRPVLFGSPDYAAKTVETPPLRNKHTRKGWKRFLRATVQRYGPGGDYWTNPALYKLQHQGAQPLPIHTYQIWNEVTLPSNFQPRPSVKRYAKLLRISHDAIDAADPHAKIILAGLFGFAYKPSFYAWNFLDRLYRRRGIKRDFDAVALHPYSPRLRFLREQIRRTRRAMKQNGDRHTRLWITELGWGSAHNDGNLNKGPKGQKRLLSKSFRLILHRRKRWHIGRLNWFSWRDPPDYNGSCSFCGHAGLFKRNHDPKPAWRAFKHFTGAS